MIAALKLETIGQETRTVIRLDQTGIQETGTTVLLLQGYLPAIQMSKDMNSPQRNPQREAALMNLEVSLIVKLLNCRIIK